MPRETNPISVIKIGGSLLDWGQIRARLQSWCDEKSSTRMVFVVGGGQLADQVREWSDRFLLDSRAAHWNCIEMMQINASLVGSWFPTWSVVDEFSKLAATPPSLRVVFRPRAWLCDQNNPLPESWKVTSDSIAARIAFELQAEELVLLKSTDPPHNPTVRSLVRAGYVDDFFPQAVRDRPVRLVNLRRIDMPEVVMSQRAAPSIP